MTRKMFCIVTINLLISLTALAYVPGFVPDLQKSPEKRKEHSKRPICTATKPEVGITVNQPRMNSTRLQGTGVEVSWTVNQLASCQRITKFHVIFTLLTNKGESLTIPATTDGAKTSISAPIPPGKVHIFSASDARTKISVRVTPVVVKV